MTGIPVELKKNSSIRVNGKELKRSPERGTSTYSNYVPRAERLKFEIWRQPFRNTSIEADFPTFQANLAKPSWRYPESLELKFNNAKGINPDSVEDTFGVVVLGDGSRLMPKFIMKEGEKLESSEGSVSMKTIPLPNSLSAHSYETEISIFRSQRLALAKLTTDYTAGSILMTYILPEKSFKVDT